MRETQCQMVLKYMEDFGAITPLEALNDLGIYRLGARIYDLRQSGHKIESRIITRANRYGRAICFAEYRLLEKMEAKNDK